MRDKIFYSVSFGIILGILFQSFFSFDFSFISLFFLLSVFLLFYFIYLSRNRWGVIAALFILAFGLGSLRLHLFSSSLSIELKSWAGDKIELTGILVNEPDKRAGNQKLVVKLSSENYQTKILVTTDFSQTYKYGDEVIIKGSLDKPENFLTDQGKTFDYINYLKKDRILYVSYYPEVEIISHGHGFFLKRALFSVKEKFLNVIDSQIKSPESILLGGLILGERGAFSEEERKKFVDTGTIHIIALSGYNVTIVAEWFIKVFKFLPGVLSIWAGIGAIFLFVLMTGAQATAVRAGIMAVLTLIARASGRTYDVARALVLAGLFMILVNPMILRYDISFQLSFIATVAVIFFAPKIERYFLWVPKRFGLRDIVSVTFAAYIFVLPVVLYKMGNLSLVALPANILILPFIPLTMLLGFATGLLGLIWHGLAAPFAILAELFLWYELKVIEVFSEFSFSAFTIPNFPLALTLLIYAWFVWKLFGKDLEKFFVIET